MSVITLFLPNFLLLIVRNVHLYNLLKHLPMPKTYLYLFRPFAFPPHSYLPLAQALPTIIMTFELLLCLEVLLHHISHINLPQIYFPTCIKYNSIPFLPPITIPVKLAPFVLTILFIIMLIPLLYVSDPNFSLPNPDWPIHL
jgi:hypothetical protein